MIKYNKEEFIKVCRESKSMAQASVQLNIHFNTFKRIAIQLECYSTNPSGKGIKKVMPSISTQDILDGKYPSYQTFKLKIRLLKEGIKENICEICKVFEWCGNLLNCELDHIDGDSSNHKLENLRIVCPNCHSQTPTFRSKIRK